MPGAALDIDGALTQPGCEAYTWAADLNAAGRIEVFERWTSEADLRAIDGLGDKRIARFGAGILRLVAEDAG